MGWEGAVDGAGEVTDMGEAVSAGGGFVADDGGHGAGIGGGRPLQAGESGEGFGGVDGSNGGRKVGVEFGEASPDPQQGSGLFTDQGFTVANEDAELFRDRGAGNGWEWGEGPGSSNGTGITGIGLVPSLDTAPPSSDPGRGLPHLVAVVGEIPGESPPIAPRAFHHPPVYLVSNTKAVRLGEPLPGVRHSHGFERVSIRSDHGNHQRVKMRINAGNGVHDQASLVAKTTQRGLTAVADNPL